MPVPTQSLKTTLLLWLCVSAAVASANINRDGKPLEDAQPDLSTGPDLQAALDRRAKVNKCATETAALGIRRLNDNLAICVQRSGPANLCQTVAHGISMQLSDHANTCCESLANTWICSAQAFSIAQGIVPAESAGDEDDPVVNQQGVGPSPTSTPVVTTPTRHDPIVTTGSTSPAPSAVVPAGETPATATKKDEVTATHDAQADIQACQSLASQAARCCANPAACDGSIDSPEAGSGSGMASCQQQKQLAAATKRAYTKMYSVCSAPQSQCERQCGGLMTTYQQLINSCGDDCPNSSVYADAMTKFSAGNRQCMGLRGMVNDFLVSSQNGAAAQGGSSLCEGETKEEGSDGADTGPSSLADLFDQNKDNEKPSAEEKTKDCQQDPTGPGCRKEAEVAPLQSGSSETPKFAESRPTVKPEDFNVGDVNMPDSYVSSTGAGTGEAPTVNTVPNNSGGGIPDAGRAPGAGAGAPRKAASAGPAYTTDVFQGGFQAGGYSASALNSLDTNTRENLFPRRRPAGEDFNQYSGVKVGTDLKSFLPGGPNDPGRLKLGAYATGATKEITSAFTDNWNKISVKFKEKCILELTGCDLQP